MKTAIQSYEVNTDTLGFFLHRLGTRVANGDVPVHKVRTAISAEADDVLFGELELKFVVVDDENNPLKMIDWNDG